MNEVKELTLHCLFVLALGLPVVFIVWLVTRLLDLF